jgi:hypothetical protein
MAEKAIQANLKGKGSVQSEWMDADAAEAELARITTELNNAMGSQFIKLGKGATVSRGEVMSVELISPPSVGFA